MTLERWGWLMIMALLLDNISQEVRWRNSFVGSYFAGYYGVDR